MSDMIPDTGGQPGLIPDTRDQQPGLEFVPPAVTDDRAYGRYGFKPPGYTDDDLPAEPSKRGAIGGGVGGGLAAAHRKTTSTSSQQQSSSASSSAAATSSPTASSASPSTTSSGIPPSSTQPGTYRIINIASNTAIDLLNGGTTNDTEIECWQWNPSEAPADNTHQSWQIEGIKSGFVAIVNTQTSSYITAPDNLTAGENPTTGNAQVYGGVPGSPTDPHVLWSILQNSDNSISFSSQAYPTKVLDLAAGSTTNGALIILWEKNGGANQEWSIKNKE
ncbi:carbohydrate-binding module family 13 protein [Hyaloscypha variabilis F]|uniref:Carbohydrate-binding module family 13 protein n=1 Tax=Hyaloscypha variabilis (strain UAMH 11265 / GT02V1 / F) TaxID=1149755 RepID=A0A2J6RHM2_HYAVF|nr:carbohydrate-binding module family 13 protein [Hyaloscypha variabilis F]